MNNTGKIPALAVRLIAALITLYLYFNPTALAHAEYSLASSSPGRSACSSRSGKSSTSPKTSSRKAKIDEGGSRRLPPSSILVYVSQRSRRRSGAKKSNPFFAAACTSQKTPCAGLGPKELASADPTVDVGPAECRRPAYGGSKRRAERNLLVKKAAPF